MAGLPPLFTSSVMVVCLVVFLLESFRLAPGFSYTCLLPNDVVSRFQVYRIYSSPFYHVGILHIFFNMLALYFLGSDFERQIGTLAAFYTVMIVVIPLCGVAHVVLAYAADAIGSLHLRLNCAVGFSGVLFALIVMAVVSSGASSVSFLGMISLPAHIYPWFMLVVLSLLSPSLSFLGHLAGIIVGYGLTSGILLPLIASDASLDAFEERFGLQYLPLYRCSTNRENEYNLVPSSRTSGLPTTQSTPSTASSSSMMSNIVSAWFSVMQAWLRGLRSCNQVQPISSTEDSPESRTGIPSSSRLLRSDFSQSQRPPSSSSALLDSERVHDQSFSSGV